MPWIFEARVTETRWAIKLGQYRVQLPAIEFIGEDRGFLLGVSAYPVFFVTFLDCQLIVLVSRAWLHDMQIKVILGCCLWHRVVHRRDC